MSQAADAARPVYDPSDPAIMADPFHALAHLRESDPVHWSPTLKSWVVTRYDDVRDLLVGDSLSVNRLMGFYRSLPARESELLRDIVHYLNLWVAFRDPPDHTRLRRIMRHAFTAPAVDAMRPGIEGIVAGLLDRLEAEGAGRVDLVRRYALLIPAYVIMDMLGIPRERVEEVKGWSDDLATFIGGARNSADKYERAARGCREMSGFFKELIAARRADPRPGFLRDLIEARDEGDELGDDELVATCILVLFAGHETTTNLISNGVLTLLRHPDQLARLMADPGLTETMVEEVMRFDGPTNALVRVVARDHELHGRLMREGERVFTMVIAANRDPRAFEAPERFDIARSPNRHLTFGQGIHVCLGAKLAREEGRAAIPALFERFPRLALDGAPDWIDAMVPRGLRCLPARLRG